METEGVIVNGSHESDIETKEEKILKPRKSFSVEDGAVVQNGTGENGGMSSGNTEFDNVENGYDEDFEDDSHNQTGKKSIRQHTEKKEGTPKRQAIKRDSKVIKESTPKPETPSKRELRRREATPKESTPKPETPSKRGRPRGTPAKVQDSGNNRESKPVEKEINGDHKLDEGETLPDNEEAQSNKSKEQIEIKLKESFVDLEEKNGESFIMSINESEEVIVVDSEPKKRSLFTAASRTSKSHSSVEMVDDCEASSSSSPSVICLGTPSAVDDSLRADKDIKGRKPINSFSRFPGRNVSITSIDRSLKRKADDSYISNEERKRFAGETESGSEKSPGWHFFSPSFKRVWTPTPQKSDTPIPSSTPFGKIEQDSMAVNYDEETKLSFDDSVESQTDEYIKHDTSSESHTRKWCSIM